MSDHPTCDTVLDLIRAHQADRGYPPSIGELAAATGAGRATIHGRLRQLHNDGRITITPGRARAITINEGESE